MPPKKDSPDKSKAEETTGNSSSSKAGQTKRKRSATPEMSEEEATRIINFLLKDAVAKFAQGSDAQQPNLFDHMRLSARYTPFQNLVASALMSKPISSRLGARTLRTIFEGSNDNVDGIDFSTPAKMRDAGEEGRLVDWLV